MNATWDRVARHLPPGLSGALSFDARPHREGNLILAGVDEHFELQVDERFDQIINWVTEATWTIRDPDTPGHITNLVLRTLRAGHDCRRRLIVWDGRIFWFNADGDSDGLIDFIEKYKAGKTDEEWEAGKPARVTNDGPEPKDVGEHA